MSLGCTLINATVEDVLDHDNDRRYGIQPHSFDYVFLFDVLEHLARPGEVLCAIKRLLGDGGRIVLTLPDAGSLSRKLMGRLWVQYKLEHLQYPSGEWHTLAAAWDLKVQRRERFYKRLPLGYLLSVGRNFGPPVVQQLVRAAAHLVPTALHGLPLSVPLGKNLVVLTANAWASLT